MKRFYFRFINDWNQFGDSSYNWKNWRIALLDFEFEDDIILSNYNFQIILFGVGFEISYVRPIETKEMKDLKRMTKELKEGTLKTIPFDELRDEFMEGRCPRCFFKIDGSE